MKALTAAFTIRRTVPADAEGCLRAHYSAVHETAAKDYPPEVLALWAPEITAERIERRRAKLAAKDGIIGRHNGENAVISFVAVNEAGQVLGFTELVPPETLGAVYVAASAGRQGVATALLQRVEAEARALKLKVLRMESSLTAAPFYAKHGFVELGRDAHPLAEGISMPCVKMEKWLIKQG